MTLLEATYRCRRGKTVDFDIATENLKNAVEMMVVDNREDKTYQMLSECLSCRYGHTGWVLKKEPNPSKKTYDVKFCRLKIVSMKEHNAGWSDDCCC